MFERRKLASTAMPIGTRMSVVHLRYAFGQRDVVMAVPR
jgi:hypothetical protein